MDETLPMLALLCWLIVMMGSLRSVWAPGPSARAPLWITIASVALAASVFVALRAWAPTVALWWWLTAWMVAALVVLWVGAYLKRLRAYLPLALATLSVLGVALMLPSS